MPARDTRKTAGRNRSPVDSVNGEIKARQDAAVDVEPPPDLEPLTDQERTWWNVYRSARASSDWRTVDLFQLHRLVKLESRLAMLNAELRDAPILVPKGPVMGENPLFAVHDRVLKQIMTIVRSLHLNSTGKHIPTMVTDARAEANVRSARDQAKDGKIALFAQRRNA